MQIAGTAPEGLSASVFKNDLEMQSFYGITLSWKLLSCHSQAVRPCTQSFVHFSKGWQPLPRGILVYVLVPFVFFPPQVQLRNFKMTYYNPDLFWIEWLKLGLMVWISFCRGVASRCTADPQGAFAR